MDADAGQRTADSYMIWWIFAYLTTPMNTKSPREQKLRRGWHDHDKLKSKSISWHAIWNNAGRPSSGLIHQIKVSSKLKYKLAIKSALLEFENKHDDQLYLNFLNKKSSWYLEMLVAEI